MVPHLGPEVALPCRAGAVRAEPNQLASAFLSAMSKSRMTPGPLTTEVFLLGKDGLGALGPWEYSVGSQRWRGHIWAKGV